MVVDLSVNRGCWQREGLERRIAWRIQLPKRAWSRWELHWAVDMLKGTATEYCKEVVLTAALRRFTVFSPSKEHACCHHITGKESPQTYLKLRAVCKEELLAIRK